MEDGPDGKGKVVVFGPNADPIYLTGPSPAYMITALSHSTDFTYYTEFKMPAKELGKKEQWVFFSLLGILPKTFSSLFVVGLRKKSTGSAGAEDTKDENG